MLAPKTITLKIDGFLKRFMWEGRRKNSRKTHLISWDKIKNPILEGGLHIRDVATQNLAMGSKILWNLISGKSSWSKQVLQKKYFPGHQIRCLDQPPKVPRGSPIFFLCLRSLDHFNSKLTWIPGNGKRRRI